MVTQEPGAGRKRKPLSLRARALGLLARREFSRHELSARLIEHGDESVVNAVLDDFEQRGWLNQARFAEQFVNSRLSRFGPRRILQELTQHKLPTELTAQAVQVAKDSEFDRALDIYRRRFCEPVEALEVRELMAKEQAKRYRFLLQRGFSASVIQKVIRSNDFNDDV